MSNTNNWIPKSQYKIGDKKVLNFINDFMTYYSTDEKRETIRELFRAGYCYQFAHMLKATFQRGRVVWCAPFGHMAWQDEDDKVYDVEGLYDNKEVFYFIPEYFLDDAVKDFAHVELPEKRTSVKKLTDIIKKYCGFMHILYDERIEKYLGFDIRLNEVVSYATRNMRMGETNGVEHIFITPEESKHLQETENILAYTKIGDFEYFVTEKILADKNLYIIDPNGVKYLKQQNIDRDLKVIYISVPDDIREERAKSRSDYETAYKKRTAAEDEQFSNFEKIKGWDKHIVNLDFEEAKKELIEYIETSYTDKTLYLIVARTCSGKDSLLNAAKAYFNEE